MLHEVPTTFDDLLAIFAMPRARMTRLLDTYGIRPAYRVGRARCYVRDQIHQIQAFLQADGR